MILITVYTDSDFSICRNGYPLRQLCESVYLVYNTYQDLVDEVVTGILTSSSQYLLEDLVYNITLVDEIYSVGNYTISVEPYEGSFIYDTTRD